MGFLHSLHDALVSINVPNGKARAVVDAMASRIVIRLGTLIVAVAGLLLGTAQLGG